jgi:D-alanyl-lipoteichoic acid acyltransferase DltB (MBOAT superfamily)
MIPFGTIALGIFWVAAIKLWFTDGPKIPVICICMWIICFFGVPLLHWPGVVFIVAEAILGVSLLLIDKYKSSLL